MLDRILIDQSRDFGMKYAQDYLKKSSFDYLLEVHSISIMGGAARCYFDPQDSIKNHKDFDLDVYFCPKPGLIIDRTITGRMNTQGTPKVYENTGFLPTKKDHLDIARITLWHPRTQNFIEDIKEYAESHKNCSRWKGSKDRPGRIGNPMIFVYPEIIAIKKL